MPKTPPAPPAAASEPVAGSVDDLGAQLAAAEAGNYARAAHDKVPVAEVPHPSTVESAGE